MRFSLFFVLALAVLLVSVKESIQLIIEPILTLSAQQLAAGKVTLLNGNQAHHVGSTVDSVAVAGSPPSGPPPHGGAPPPPRTTTASSG